jgi:NTP pyrophosphatase (non-canonical NTP hydrolase)
MKYASYRSIETEVLQWGDARGITKYGTALGQAKKTREEAQELYDAVLAGDREKIADGIGDVLVTLVMVGALVDMDVVQCFAHAYEEIKDRKGHMAPDGTFVKDA